LTTLVSLTDLHGEEMSTPPLTMATTVHTRVEKAQQQMKRHKGQEERAQPQRSEAAA